MNSTVRLCLVLHNHQPVGNFDGVIEQAYQDSYLPFLDVFEPFEHLKISLHTSGPLMQWLADNHPEYLHRVATLVAAGRIEIIGGPYYEPILTMIPSRDRIGQIQRYTEWLEDRFDTRVKGMWMPERVWESSLTTDLVAAGMEYTVLDDFHFRAAGCSSEQLTNYFLTEDDGNLIKVFPGSEPLRYLIPFASVDQSIEYARSVANASPGAVLVFGDDGEKFGTWPDTKAHVYERGWLRDFLTALDHNRDWLITSTLQGVADNTPAAGKIYLPDCSYREMTEWALPVAQQELYDHVIHELQEHSDWQTIQRFMRGGFWRNFKVKYTETNEMYSRMLQVSRRLEAARAAHRPHALINLAEDHLYRSQCNCPYWHGAFGGIYLPHLRNAVFHEMIQADNLLEEAEHEGQAWVDATLADYDLDQNSEVRLANDQLIAYVAPVRGGMIYELDVRAIAHNLLSTLQRRPESYHRKVLAGPSQAGGDVASIHDRVVFKQEGLDQRLQYDIFPRKSFLDHFYDEGISVEQIAAGHADERGDFVALPFDAKLRRGNGKVQLQLCRDGNAWGVPLRITKALTLEAGSSRMHVAYLIEGLPQDRPMHFAMEWNFAGMPSGADDRFFYDQNGNQMGHLGSKLDVVDAPYLGLIDQWQGLDVQLAWSQNANIWTYPIETVSQSEGGFELVHQAVCVMPHWTVVGDSEGKWSIQMEIEINASHQPNRQLADFFQAVV